jgi:hypothetical protein
MPVIPALRRLRQEDCKFEDTLGHTAKTLSQKNNNEGKGGDRGE